MKTTPDQRYFEARLENSGGQVSAIAKNGSHWSVSATFSGNVSHCPRCGARTKPYGWRQIVFRDAPASDGCHVEIVARRPRNRCQGCGDIFTTEVSCLDSKTRMTKGFETYLRKQLLVSSSIRELARHTALSAKTVRSVLIDGVHRRKTDLGIVDRIAIRSLNVGRQSYLVIFNTVSGETIHLLAEPKADFTSLLDFLGPIRATTIDLPADPVLAHAIRQHIPDARLTVSVESLHGLSLRSITGIIRSNSYKFRRVGLTKPEALRISQGRISELDGYTKGDMSSAFSAGYQLKEQFMEALTEQLSYRDAARQIMERAPEVCRPYFLPMYFALNRLYEFGVGLTSDPKIESLDAKLKLFRARSASPGRQLELPIFGALVSIFFGNGFSSPSLWHAVKETISELRDLLAQLQSSWLSRSEVGEVLLAPPNQTHGRCSIFARNAFSSHPGVCSEAGIQRQAQQRPSARPL